MVDPKVILNAKIKIASALLQAAIDRRIESIKDESYISGFTTWFVTE